MHKWLVSLAIFSLSPFVLAQGSAEEGQKKSAICTSCHGAEGKSPIPSYPHLAGQNQAYLALAIKAYKSGERTGSQASIMKGMTASLSDADIENLAAYYSSLKP